jgi:hypothetical protein
MDRSIVLSLAGLLLIVAVLVDTMYFDELAKKWVVDPTASIVNGGSQSILKIIKPPETRVVGYQDRSIILLDNMSETDENALFAEARFRDALASGDRLLLYSGMKGLSAFVASHYFNDVEVDMLSRNDTVTKALESHYPPGIVNFSYIDVSDPTNAKIDMVGLWGSKISLLVPHDTSSENFSDMSSSDEFDKVLEDSSKLRNKTLVLYHPSKSSMNTIIPIGFSDEEVKLLAKNSAVKTALDMIDVKKGETLNLADTREFSQVNMAQLPHQPNTKIYAYFDIVGELGFISQDMLVYMAIFVVILVVLYTLYSVLVT